MIRSYKEIESLERKLEETKSGWERLPLLISISHALRQYSGDKAHQRGIEALNLAKELKDRFWIASSSHAIALSLQETGNFTEMVFYLTEASRTFQTIDDRRRKAEVDYLLGTTFISMGKSDKAKSFLQDAFKFFSDHRNESWIIRLRCAFGDIKQMAGSYPQALYYYRQGLAAAKKLQQGNPADVYMHLSALYERVGDRKRQAECLRRALQLYRKDGDRGGMGLAMAGMVPLFIERGLTTHAGKYIQRARQIFHELGWKPREAELWYWLSEMYRRKGDERNEIQCCGKGIVLAKQTEDVVTLGLLYEQYGALQVRLGDKRKGLAVLWSAHNLMREFGDPYFLHRVHNTLACAYESSGNPEMALDHYKHSIALTEQFLTGRKGLMVGRIEMRSKICSLIDQLQNERHRRKKMRQKVEEKDIRLTALTLQLIQVSETLRKEQGGNITESLNGCTNVTSAPVDETWNAFARHFSKLDQKFSARLMHLYPQLTPAEIKVCSLIRIGHSSCEIAQLLSVSKRTIDRHRENIRAKLGLPCRESLSTAIHKV